jgi:hypothetical protein
MVMFTFVFLETFFMLRQEASITSLSGKSGENVHKNITQKDDDTLRAASLG